MRPSLTKLGAIWRHRRTGFGGLATVIAIRLGLCRNDFLALRERLLAGTMVTTRRDDATARRLLKATTISARLVPGATCLTQALSAQVLLARHGIASEILLGVRKDESGALKAHAWLYYDDKIALGGRSAAASGFTELASFGTRPQ